MTISYNWLSEYLPVKIDVDRISKILTSVGLEVERVAPYEGVPGGMQGIVIGEVLTCTKHPDADKLSLTTVNIGEADPLQIVCGAPNVAAGQKVVVATVGTTIYPTTGEPLTMKKAKIRGVESFGMICAEDELGLGTSHDGIMVLPTDTAIGTKAADYFGVYNDFIIEIGLTPNHMDAQSHIGVARDVVAYLNHHEKANYSVKLPYSNAVKFDKKETEISVTVEPNTNCNRYAGLLIKNITVKESPKWLQDKLKAIDLRPINNVVDITNFILHETGQPLHAFDAQKIDGNQIIVRTAHENEKFLTLDEKERSLHREDVMIANANSSMCIGGVFGGLQSGVSANTTSIFLESAIFDPTFIRKSSLRHGLRTDAAVRFEKGVDVSNVVNVLKRAALLITEIAGGEVASSITDIYPKVAEKQSVSLRNHYLKKLSGKNYHSETVKGILQNLGFEIAKETMDEITVLVPFHKTDISIPADLVEEIMRIDGLDNVEIPKTISISPMVDISRSKETLKEKIAQTFVGMGLQEIFTNSITSSAYVAEDAQPSMVKMLNNLSADLDVLRTEMYQTGLPSIVHNINRKNADVQFFEFGKTYGVSDNAKYFENEKIAIYVTGQAQAAAWNSAANQADLFYIKMIVEQVLAVCGVTFSASVEANQQLQYKSQNKQIATVYQIPNALLQQFDIKQPIFYAEILWDNLFSITEKQKVTYKELSKFPPVQRDLSLLINKAITYAQIETAIKKAGVKKLTNIALFDVFEHEKLGLDNKSLSINLTFVDEEKTLEDKEIDSFTQKIIANLQKETGATLRS